MRGIRIILAVWGALVVGIVVLLLVTPGKDDAEIGDRAPPPLSCSTLQKRARECQRELVTVAGDFVERASLEVGRSSFTAGGRRFLVANIMDEAIRKDEVQRRCEAERTANTPLFQRYWPELARCWPQRGCPAFVACLRRVAEAEQAAGRLPL